MDDLPLKDKRVVLLRALHQTPEMEQKLIDLGANVIRYPMISIIPLKDNLSLISQRYLTSFDTVIFTSANAVRIFMDYLWKRYISKNILLKMQVIAVGMPTASVLFKYGVRVNLIPKNHVAEGIVDAMPKDLSGRQILIPKAEVSRSLIEDELRRRDAHVQVLKIYKNVKPKAMTFPVVDGDYVAFTSSSTVQNFFENKKDKKIAFTAFGIGEVTADELDKYNKKCVISTETTTDSLIESMVMYRKKESK
jgi:uroporphyrinogen III methyltransferase / synthase